MDIKLTLITNYPGAQWVLDGEEYSGLEWLDDSPKPTKEELEAAWPDVKYQSEYDAVTVARQQAYATTSDPIFMQYQRDEATKQEWLDAVQAVKDANPYPVFEEVIAETPVVEKQVVEETPVVEKQAVEETPATEPVAVEETTAVEPEIITEPAPAE